jgi:hypothetical protein
VLLSHGEHGNQNNSELLADHCAYPVAYKRQHNIYFIGSSENLNNRRRKCNNFLISGLEEYPEFQIIAANVRTL